VAAVAAVRSTGDLHAAHVALTHAVQQLRSPTTFYGGNSNGTIVTEHVSSPLSFLQGHGRGCPNAECRQFGRFVGGLYRDRVHAAQQGVSAARADVIGSSAGAGGALAAAGAIGLGPRVRVARWRAAARAASRSRAARAD
jgi:hypothetical protein